MRFFIFIPVSLIIASFIFHPRILLDRASVGVLPRKVEKVERVIERYLPRETDEVEKERISDIREVEISLVNESSSTTPKSEPASTTVAVKENTFEYFPYPGFGGGNPTAQSFQEKKSFTILDNSTSAICVN